MRYYNNNCEVTSDKYKAQILGSLTRKQMKHTTPQACQKVTPNSLTRALLHPLQRQSSSCSQLPLREDERSIQEFKLQWRPGRCLYCEIAKNSRAHGKLLFSPLLLQKIKRSHCFHEFGKYRMRNIDKTKFIQPHLINQAKHITSAQS